MTGPANGRRTTAIVLAMMAALTAMTQVATAQDRAYSIAPIAVTGEPAPGTGGLSFEWVALSDFDLAQTGGLINTYLNDSGVVAFIGSTDPLNPDIREAVWVGTPGNLTLAARAGDPVPGGTAQSFREFTATFLNETGGLAVQAYTSDGQLYGSGIWAGPVGNLGLVAMDGDPAPGTAGRTFGSFLIGAFDDLGTVSFYSQTFLTDDPLAYETGIWTGTQDLLEPVVVTGDPASGPGGFAFGSVLGPLSNNADSMAFFGQTSDASRLYPSGLWTAGPAGLSLTALQGNEAPGTGGRTFREFGGPATETQIVGEPFAYGIFGPVLTAAGDVAFGAYLENLIDPNIWRGDHGIWVRDTAGLRLIALAGDAAPGTASAAFLEFNHINFNAQGLMAFDASLNVTDPDRDHGIWLGPPDALGLVVREGDPAPGAAGETFGSLIMGPELNDSGKIVFNARLRESNSDGVWAGTPGNLALILREGESVETKPGDYRTIQSIAFFNGGAYAFTEGRRFNNAGQLVFLVTFTDGSKGLLLASPVAGATNQPPLADAGPDETVVQGQTIALDGSGSTDPEKTVLSFVWSVGGVEIATGPTPTVGGLPPGAHTVTLTVTDREGASATDEMVLTVIANQPPVASAGPDQTVSYIDTVTFDGAGSGDPDGGPITYSWSIGGIEFATGPTPTAGPFVTGTFTVTLTVTDERGASASDTMILTVLNLPPVANAGLDSTIQTLETVALDASGSSDPEGSTLSYAWSLDGAQIATGSTPVVGPFDAGTHTITLTVTDDHGASASDDMVLTVLNRAPTAGAGPDRRVTYVETVTLDGSASSDPEGDILGYVWSIGGVKIATGISPTVGPFEVGVFTVTLTVTDSHGATATDSMTITVVNKAPIANAGPDQTINLKGKDVTVTLDGSASTDPEGSALSFMWSLGGQTVGTGAIVQITLSQGTHFFTLAATDELGATDYDTVVVTVTRGGGS